MKRDRTPRVARIALPPVAVLALTACRPATASSLPTSTPIVTASAARVAATSPAATHAVVVPVVTEAVVHVSARTDDTGRDLPVRVVVHGIAGTPDPELGPPDSARGAHSVVVLASGHGDVRVPRGRYVFTVSHGPEWSVAHGEVDVTHADRAEVSATLSHVLAMPDDVACDLHVHAAPSGDSSVSIADRVAALVAEGVAFAAASEHNTVGDYTAGVGALPPAAVDEAVRARFTWIPAVEVTTDRAPAPSGHFNVYPYERDPSHANGAPPPWLVPPGEIFMDVRARHPESLIQVNHPRAALDIGYFDLVQLDPHTNTARSPLYDPHYDALEVFNGYFMDEPAAVDAVLHDWLALLASGARYVGTASSDSHVIAFQGAGYPRTYVHVPDHGDGAPDAARVLRALREGRAFGTSGPMIELRIGRATLGDTVHARGATVVAHVEVRAVPRVSVEFVELYLGDTKIETIAVPPTRAIERLVRDVTVTLPTARWTTLPLVAVARGSVPMDDVLPGRHALPFAFTNPVWIAHRR